MFKVYEMVGNFSKEVAMFETESEASEYLEKRWFQSDDCNVSEQDEYDSLQQLFFSYFSIEDDGREKIDDGQLTEMYDDMLDDCYPEMFNMSPSQILYKADNIAYMCGLNDYYDSICDSYYCEEME
jgi:hypothetical protein